MVNLLLIAANAFLFFVQTAQGPLQDQFIFTYGLVPARYSVPEIGAHFTSFHQVLALVSFMFLHGGFWHLAAELQDEADAFRETMEEARREEGRQSGIRG